MDEQSDNATGRSQGVLHLHFIGSRVQTRGFPQEQTGGLKCVFEGQLATGLQLFSILEPLNSGSRFGSDVKLEFHIGTSLVLDLVEILLRDFNLWGTWMINQNNRWVSSNSDVAQYQTELSTHYTTFGRVGGF